MNSPEMNQRRKRRLSLSVRVSGLLILAAILPLIIIVVISELTARPALTNQASAAMATDARTRVQLINTYLNERTLDAETLGQVPTVQSFLALPPAMETQDSTRHALYALAAGIFRDKRYTTWALFDPRGNVRLYFPTTKVPQPHGKYPVPLENLKAVDAGQTFISAVYYDPDTKKASVDIYSPIAMPTTHQLLGFIRASLNIDYIWNDVVSGDLGANGAGSYAFILDQNGVRIADTDSSRLFHAVAPLPSNVEKQITSEARYGNASIVPVLADSTLASIHKSTSTPSTFQMTPGGQNGVYEVTRLSTTVTPWTYYVLSPLSTVTAVANQQLYFTCAIALLVIIIAALYGWGVGRRITSPIMNSVEYLRNNSETLNALATRQQGAANEQTWVVDSSQVGLQSVQYYTDATQVAARRLSEIGMELTQRWHQLDAQTAKQALAQMIAAAQYIERSTEFQTVSSEKLSTAIKVTTQVTEQLASGATAAADTSEQLEQVVNQLRHVVGR
jgi:C4-dicarboxylate-specific signal transduction histidine kinase